MAFAPTKPWKLPFITTWGGSPNRNLPTNSAEEAEMSMTTTTTLADVAATSLSAVRTLERHGLDYCCGGKQPFDEACAAKGLKPESVMQEIERPQAPDASERDWQTAPLDEIVKHIVGTHHEYLKLELPALGNRMNKVLAVHGTK